MKKAAIILAGCGHLDGSDIQEVMGCLWALSVERFDTHAFSPDIRQKEVIDHIDGKPVDAPRNILHESARFSQSSLRPMRELSTSEFSALFIPGGYGALKNLSDYSGQGYAGKTQPDLHRILTEFTSAGIPVGTIGLSSLLAAISLRNRTLHLTFGSGSGETAIFSQEAEKLGHKVITSSVDNCVVDLANKLVTSPGTVSTPVSTHEVFTGIHKCVTEVAKLGLSPK